MYYLGIDLGGTNIAVGIVDEENKIIARATSKTKVDNAEQVADAMAETAREALKNAGMEDVYVIGVDGCSVGYDQVREGTQALCIGQSFAQMTQDAFDTITKLLNGEELENDVIWTNLDVVTAETIDDYPYPEW